ncbi:MAG: DUF5615 family PIN-like protein [Anaerolineales bacterium]|nr:DUF5615 family PIN-like protein [Anaerolineales bacterium]
MKFLADMGISPRTISYLTAQGFDAIHLHELKLDRMSDAEILLKARQDDFIILTHDLDFGDLLAASGEILPSVIIFRLKDMRPDNVNHYIQVAIAQYKDELDKGAILSVNERRIRVRKLPI